MAVDCSTVGEPVFEARPGSKNIRTEDTCIKWKSESGYNFSGIARKTPAYVNKDARVVTTWWRHLHLATADHYITPVSSHSSYITVSDCLTHASCINVCCRPIEKWWSNKVLSHGNRRQHYAAICNVWASIKSIGVASRGHHSRARG